MFLAEGEHVVRRAFAAGLNVRSVLVVEAKVERVEAMARGSHSASVEILVCSKAMMAESVGVRLHQGIIAAVEPPPTPTLDDVLGDACGLKSARPAGDGHQTIVVCPEITNTENLGLLVRVCAGLGVAAMVLGPACCDPWYRRAVRVSMGAVFTMPLVRSADMGADLRRLRNEFDYELIATVIDADAEDLREAAVSPNFRGNVRRNVRGNFRGRSCWAARGTVCPRNSSPTATGGSASRCTARSTR